jgi:hypothetical protein
MAGATAVFASLIGFRLYGLDGACWAAGVTCVVMVLGSDVLERWTSIRRAQTDQRLYNIDHCLQGITRKMADLENRLIQRDDQGQW